MNVSKWCPNNPIIRWRYKTVLCYVVAALAASRLVQNCDTLKFAPCLANMLKAGPVPGGIKWRSKWVSDTTLFTLRMSVCYVRREETDRIPTDSSKHRRRPISNFTPTSVKRLTIVPCIDLMCVCVWSDHRSRAIHLRRIAPVRPGPAGYFEAQNVL